ncbi:MAG: hypothetical protein KF746_02850 [Chitinophagaceae bacterium]|nr:hypothetical protein [Chitinophagaceae bacterium]
MKMFKYHPQTSSDTRHATRAYRLLFITFFAGCALASFSQVPIPQFKSFQPIEPGKNPQFQSSPLFQPQRLSSLLPNDPYVQQNARILQQAAMNAAQNNREMQRAPDNYIADDERRVWENYYRYKSGRYQQHLGELLSMNPDDFSITRAIYLVESAWYDKPPTFEAFEKEIQLYADAVKQILKREGLDIQNNGAVNYGIQKLYKQDNPWHDRQSGKTYKIEKLGYDFNDPMGDSDWSNMFVDKLLRKRAGQCHSLPLLYLCIIEQLGGKAYLSLSPNHSFIQYFGSNGKRYNFETTNGNHVTESWLLQSTFVSAAALANKTYLDTLSGKQLYARMLGDLLLGYRKQLGYDRVGDMLVQKIQSVDADNMTALMDQATIAHIMLGMQLEASGNPLPEQWNNYPGVMAAYNRRQGLYQKIDATGHQEMPPEIYQQWLQSMQQEEQRQQDKAEYEKLLKELNRLKNIKPSLKSKPKQ